MPTTVHIPEALLARVDARARAMRISRNRLVVMALEEKLTPPRRWPPEVVRLLSTPVGRPLAQEVDRMMASIRSARRSRKKPVKL
ncbi:MAG: ribbon-helix-helix protein, CopG family [Deltaproteobacteria bacterium]|nr:ribbon-helix-helix protein, CopG family [Deltaproteobacteria bacterium]